MSWTDCLTAPNLVIRTPRAKLHTGHASDTPKKQPPWTSDLADDHPGVHPGARPRYSHSDAATRRTACPRPVSRNHWSSSSAR
ncbi:hypothetical protein FRAHR75_330010 [Frankia sp. Hr75.2]|nr:hypothetical protein FRAHR75_330010 [Frankia sp. Hr75.2]